MYIRKAFLRVKWWVRGQTKPPDCRGGAIVRRMRGNGNWRMDHQTAAFDTRVLCRPFDRRFITSTWQGLGCKVAILPRVAHEMYGTMTDNEADHWHSVLNGEEAREGVKYSPVARYNIVSAASKGVRKWIRDEIDAQERDGFERQSALELVAMSREEKAEASKLAALLPLREVSPQREHSIVKRFLDNIQAGSFPDCGSSALDAWLSAEGPKMAVKARASLVPSPARETEARRIKAVPEAASKAGWSPSP